MLSLTNRLSSVLLHKNGSLFTKNGTGDFVQYYRSASVKLTPHDVSMCIMDDILIMHDVEPLKLCKQILSNCYLCFEIV